MEIKEKENIKTLQLAQKIISFINKYYLLNLNMENETIEQKEEIKQNFSYSANQERIPFTLSLHKATIEKIKQAMQRDNALNKSRYVEAIILQNL